MNVRDTLAQLGMHPNRQRGQNFLINPGVLDSIVEKAELQGGENVLEIGPGLGALTERLLARGPVSAIEIEPRFCEYLTQTYPTLKITCADVREVDLTQFGSGLVVFGNLPYSFSTDILMHLLSNAKVISRAVLMLQREFVERMASPPGGKEYGALSVACQLWADVELGPVVRGGSFHPPPEIDSRIVVLKFLGAPRHGLTDLAFFRKVVRASFMRRRKKLHNSLRMSGYFTGEAIDKAFQVTAIDSSRRAETLSVKEFVDLANALGS